jgi:AraC family transcriptional regulator
MTQFGGLTEGKDPGIILAGGEFMAVKYVEKNSLRIMGYSYKTTGRDGQNLEDIPKFWKSYIQDGQMEKLHMEKNLASRHEYGICMPENPANNELEYIIGVEITGRGESPGGYRYLEIPASKYAVFLTEPSDGNNFTNNIQKLWGYIFSKWAKETGRKIDETGISYELYNETCMTKDKKICEIYIPLRE